MGADPITLALLAANVVIGGAGVYSSNQNQRRAVSAQNAANRAQQEQANLQFARQQRDAIRQARLARARATNAAATQGALGSSGSMGGLASIQAQLGSNLSFLDTYNKFSDQATTQLGRANVFNQRAQTANAVTNLAMSTMPYAGQAAKGFEKIFSAGG